MTPFYQLTATRLRGQPLSMADYAGKVVLVVNTASHCGSHRNTLAWKRSTKSTRLRGW